MSGETTPQTPRKAVSLILLLELAIPVCSFGGALLALFFSGSGSSIDIRYFGAGCVISSFALAYLAWIRPRKDIVALTTPIYSVIFFIVPSDLSVTIFLELLYSISLTILLIRMKSRFGSAPESGVAEGKNLEEPLKSYCETVHGQAPVISPETAHRAALVFARFARGDYLDAVHEAEAAMTGQDSWPQLATAFAVVREQAQLLDRSADQPEQFLEFSAPDAGFLAKPLPADDNINARFEVSLDNALLLLYAAAWNESEGDRPLLLTGQGFARKLFAP